MAENGNGNGRSNGWAGVTPAAVVFLLLGGISSVVFSGFATDRAEQWQAIRAITDGQNSLDAIVERVQQVKDMALANKARIEAAFLELDTKLQNELRLADATLDTQINNLDRRLQQEIGNNARSLVSLDEAIRDIRATAWTNADHAEFERKAGLSLNWPESARLPRTDKQ